MKLKFQIILSLLCSITMLLQSCQKSVFSKKANSTNKRIIGQTAPNDMVFIEGTKEIPSFYMSISEEPNINYQIYLKWLAFTFKESYPEVYEEALPKTNKSSDLFKFNDPYINAYSTHPAFSYYPVTGLSWMQIQNYLQWKTDRLNEAILMEIGIINFNPEQKDEDNFNTEAYLFEQYEGSVRKNIRTEYGGERKINFSDGVLLPGFRLPTEAEWEYANQPQFQKSIDRKRCLNPFSKNAINHPYGQNYFTKKWGEFYEKIGYYSDGGGTYGRSDPANIYNVSDFRKKGIPYNADEHDRNGTPQRLTSIGDYNPNEYGLINMETNVKEWVMDFYEEEFDDKIKDPLVILEKSGFEIENPAIIDENGYFVEKDSLGRMRNFRILGISSTGESLKVGNYQSPQYEKLKKKRKLIQSKLYLENTIEDLEKNSSRILLRRKKTREDIAVINFLLKNKTSKGIDEEIKVKDHVMLKHYERLLSSQNGRAMLRNTLDQFHAQLKNTDIEHNKSRIEKIQKEINAINSELKNNPAKKRLVKGGTWQKTGNQRMGLAETDSNVEVGFRSVIPYMGMPVSKSLKVKWKR